MTRTPRRTFLKAGVAAGAWSALGTPAIMSTSKSPSVIVVGAGAFGGWTALHLRRAGCKVTLVDTWGPGNSRASSGGETRVIRSLYGPDLVYAKLNQRALALWKENEQRWGQRLFHRTGVLWMSSPDEIYEQAGVENLKKLGVQFEHLTNAQAARRWPQIDLAEISSCVFEQEAGYLTARRACEQVLLGFLAEGGDYLQVEARPGRIASARIDSVILGDGRNLTADQYVFACGPWLGKLFPDVLGNRITPTRQEVFFFGYPANDSRYWEESLPAWIDDGKQLFYGIPGNQWRGFKLANDTRGPDFDPTSGDRMPTPAGAAAARAYMEKRFPGMKGAPLVESRVCQYENSSDHHFILDRHPAAENLWLLGGGSGHGFKHGPAFGEMAANAIIGRGSSEPAFQLKRFRSAR
jgi:glycine/D-amino acid oxidase-like deaminating enzyme